MKKSVSISFVLMLFPTFAHADGVMPLGGILVFAFIIFVLAVFLIYGLVCGLAKIGGKTDHNNEGDNEK